MLSGLPKWSDLIKSMLKEMPDLKYDENKLSSDDYLKLLFCKWVVSSNSLREML